MGDSAYSFSLTTFSPSGKLVQIEYALNAVASGATSLGVKGSRTPRFLNPPRNVWHKRSALTSFSPSLFARAAKNGVVIATEKKLPSVLIDETSLQKILMLTENIAIVSAHATSSSERAALRLAAWRRPRLRLAAC